MAVYDYVAELADVRVELGPAAVGDGGLYGDAVGVALVVAGP